MISGNAKMKKKLINSSIPQGRPEVSDGSNWYTLALKEDFEIDDDIYALLQALNDEVL